MKTFAFAALLLAGGQPTVAAVPPELAASLQAIAAEAPTAPALVVAFRKPGKQWAFAAGLRRAGGKPDDAAVATDPFRIASVTKSFTAAAILRVVEDGAIGLDDPIGPLLPSGLAELLASGGYRPDRITVRHLLAHGAGLRDYATTASYAEAVGTDPLKPWTAREQVALAVAAGKPLFAPGAGTRYSDTGYVLLGEILVVQTKLPLPEAVRSLLRLDRYGTAAIDWEQIPPTGGSGLPANAIRAAQGDVDTGDFDPRFDYHGGGGMVASAPALLNAFAAVVDGQLFLKPQTASLMQQVPGPPDEDGSRQALGLQKVSYGNLSCFGHNGHWGTMAVWCPTVHAGFVLSTNAASEPAYKSAGAVHRLLAKHLSGHN